MDKTEINNLIKDLVEKTLVSVNEINVSEDSGGTTWFSVQVDNPHPFWGRGGEAMMALNHLIRRIVENSIPQEVKKDGNSPTLRVLVDINGFQKKKIDSVKATAHMMAERARYFKSSIEIDPMSSFERRIVHEFLALENDLKTESVGEGLSRRVVIKYVGSL